MDAWAKINLYLHITGKLDNGYHTLDSIMVNVPVFDVIDAQESEEVSLKITGEFAQKIDAENNIVINAARILRDEAGIKNCGAEISLQKNIPVGAGLGGGSADAAATLKLLNKLWGIDYSTEKLMEIGFKLGADVPFFFLDSPAYVSGVGEVVEKIENMPKLNVLLVNPGQVLLTKNVFTYASIKASGVVERSDNIVDILHKTKNDLQENACAIAPEITEVVSAISKQKGCFVSRMSGSGSTCFGLFDSKDSLNIAKKEIKNANKNWWVM